MSASAALVVAAGLAGCGKHHLFCGTRPSPQRVDQPRSDRDPEPQRFYQGRLQIVDAYYDIRNGYTGQPAAFSISGFGGALPITIQNMPEEQVGRGLRLGRRQPDPGQLRRREDQRHGFGLEWPSSSIFMTRNGTFVFAASQQSHVLTVVNQSNGILAIR